MKIENFEDRVIKKFGRDRVKINEPMSPHTTFRIGGPADFYFEARNGEEVQNSIKLCLDYSLPYFVLGVGANLLVGDKGIRGLVVRPMINTMEVVGPFSSQEAHPKARLNEHYQAYDQDQYLKFDDLDINEPSPDTLVRIGAGVSLPVLISWTLELGLTGLQNFAGIPASVGGCLYNNIHGGSHLFDEFVHEVVILDKEGEILKVPHSQMDFSYDQSRLQKTRETVLEIVLALSHGDAERARRVRLEWLQRKLKVQPQKDCPGCVFKNISLQEAEKIGAPTVATAWIIDQGLRLKGTNVGGVKISEKHANFFVNNGTGTARDVLELIKICKQKAKEKFGIDLLEEIQMVGDF